MNVTKQDDTKLWRAVNTALQHSLAEDSRVLVMGQDVAKPGGTYGLTRRLLDEFGPERVRDAPISEAALVSAGIGAAMMGMRPVVEVMFFDFITLAMDQLVNQAAKYRFFTRDEASVPLVINTLYGGRANMGGQHSQSLEAWLCHVPGLKVAFPSNPQDAYGVLRAAVADPDPVVVVTPIALLREKGTLDTTRVQGYGPGTGRLAREGGDATVVSYGPAFRLCERAVADLDANVDLIDLRWLQPWDDTLVRTSLRKTGRLLVVHDAVEEGGWGAEIVARLTYDEFWYLDAPPTRVGARSSTLPVATEDWQPILPSVERIRTALAELVNT